MGVCKVSDEQSAQRPISMIAANIDAMLCMSTREDMYGVDSAQTSFSGSLVTHRRSKGRKPRLSSWSLRII